MLTGARKAGLVDTIVSPLHPTGAMITATVFSKSVNRPGERDRAHHFENTVAAIGKNFDQPSGRSRTDNMRVPGLIQKLPELNAAIVALTFAVGMRAFNANRSSPAASPTGNPMP